MAAANKVFVSPGVYTSENDLTFVSQSVGVTTLGIAGETLRGPAFEPIFISNYDEFQTFFGGTSTEKFINTQIPKYEAAFIAKSYLTQSNQLYVSRVLGLSGYDAGPSWSLKVNANMDPSTVSLSSCTTYCVDGEFLTSGCTAPAPMSFSVNFTGSTCSMDGIVLSGDSVFTDNLLPLMDENYQKFNGSISTLLDDIKEQIHINMLNSGSTSGTSISVFGSIPSGSTLSAYTDSVNVFNVPSPMESDQLDSRMNDSWYFAMFDQFNPDSDVLSNGLSTVPNYSGMSFYTTLSDMTFVEQTCVTGATPTTTTTTTDPCATPGPAPIIINPIVSCCNTYTGTLTGTIYVYYGKQFNAYQDLVVATLRSRGLSTYSNDDGGPSYEMTNLNYLSMDCATGNYSMVKKNPFSTFALSGYTDAGKPFQYKVSLGVSDKNHIDKVFGVGNFDKNRNDVPLFVEENYSNLLEYAWNRGFIRGLQCDLLAMGGARSSDPQSLGWYLDRYQAPLTPYIVSEMRGNKLFKLFRFHSISDGNNANTEIKISIANISFNNLTFDVIVRSFSDTDENPVVLERFSNCSMDPASTMFVGRRIGTYDGDYELKSRYVMVEMSHEFPSDSLPCGFEGYLTREYSDATSPFPVFKTKYDKAGEITYNPPFGTPFNAENAVRSGGDKLRTTYLGFSSKVPTDPDFLQYKGKKNTSPSGLCSLETSDEWLYMTRGFHMDIDAATLKINGGYVTDGSPAFFAGETTFTKEPTSTSNPYYKLQSRKFTLNFQGGFDGWDIYRESRTNTNEFVYGGSGYRKGACPTVDMNDSTGTGMFKRISVGDDSVEYSNTDYYAYLYAIRQFANPEAVSINVLVTPGIDMENHSDLVEQTISMVEVERADSLYIATMPDTDLFNPMSPDKVDIYQPDDVVGILEASNVESNYTASYYPWILVRDGSNNSQVYIPPTAEVCRNLALTDNTSYPWFSTAGYTRGLVDAVRARVKLTQNDRNILYQGRINPIATFSDVGPIIWGNRNLQVRPSALNRINVRRLLLQTRKVISAASSRLLFEQNDIKLKEDFLNTVNPILNAIRRDRGITEFRVTVSQTTEDMDRHQIVGKIYIKPTQALEFISVEFNLTPSGSSFEDI